MTAPPLPHPALQRPAGAARTPESFVEHWHHETQAGTHRPRSPW